MRKRSSLLLIVVLGAGLLTRNRHRRTLQRIVTPGNGHATARIRSTVDALE